MAELRGAGGTTARSGFALARSIAVQCEPVVPGSSRQATPQPLPPAWLALIWHDTMNDNASTFPAACSSGVIVKTSVLEDQALRVSRCTGCMHDHQSRGSCACAVGRAIVGLGRAGAGQEWGARSVGRRHLGRPRRSPDRSPFGPACPLLPALTSDHKPSHTGANPLELTNRLSFWRINQDVSVSPAKRAGTHELTWFSPCSWSLEPIPQRASRTTPDRPSGVSMSVAGLTNRIATVALGSPSSRRDDPNFVGFTLLDHAPPDHHYKNQQLTSVTPEWSAQVKKEHKILSTSLPPNILV